MTIMESSITINASKETVWSVLANLGGVVNYHPFIDNSYYNTDATEGTGAGRVCEFNNGMKINERAIHWNDGTSYTLAIEFITGPVPPIKDIRGTLMVEQAEANTSKVTMRMDYKTRFGIIGKVMDRRMVQPQYGRMLDGIMAGLKHHVETGEVVDMTVLKRVSVVPAAA